MKIQTKWLEKDRLFSNLTWVFQEEKLDTGERKSSHGPGSDTTCVTPWIVRRCAKATASQGTHYILDNIATYRQRWNLLNNAVVVVIGKERLLTWVENYTSLCYIHFYSTLICNDQRISFLIYIYIYQKFAMEILSSVAQSENLCSHAVCSRLTSRLQCLLYHVFHVFHVFPLRKGMKTHVKKRTDSMVATCISCKVAFGVGVTANRQIINRTAVLNTEINKLKTKRVERGHP